MNTERWNRFRGALWLVGLVLVVTVVAGQDLRREREVRRGTVQSELDYLRTAKVPISVELKQVTMRQAYDGIAGKAGLSITYEGRVNDEAKRDVSFKNTTLKDVLDKLGATYKLTYRVDGPDKLTVIGSTSI